VARQLAQYREEVSYMEVGGIEYRMTQNHTKDYLGSPIRERPRRGRLDIAQLTHLRIGGSNKSCHLECQFRFTKTEVHIIYYKNNLVMSSPKSKKTAKTYNNSFKDR